MLVKNCYADIDLFRFGWKHGGIDDRANRIVISTRNPYAWLASIHKYAAKRPKIFHTRENIPFKEFLQSEYIWDSDMWGEGSPSVYMKASNPMSHWNEMNHQWLDHPAAKSVVRYESLIADADEQLSKLCSELNLTRRLGPVVYPSDRIAPGKSMSHKKTSNSPEYAFAQEWQQKFDAESIVLANQQLDKKLMAKLDYAIQGVNLT